MKLTNADWQLLGKLCTFCEGGVHFTKVYPDDWLEKMELHGIIKINKPVHEATGIPYSREYWTVQCTPIGMDEGEARNWGN